jgi:hypothetical protein
MFGLNALIHVLLFSCLYVGLSSQDLLRGNDSGERKRRLPLLLMVRKVHLNLFELEAWERFSVEILDLFVRLVSFHWKRYLAIAFRTLLVLLRSVLEVFWEKRFAHFGLAICLL